MKYLRLTFPLLILVGFGMIHLARYKIRRICEKYPIEEQLKHGACCGRGGPWIQKTNSP